MQKSLSELSALPEQELSELIDGMRQPLLVTQNGEPRFVAQSLDEFDSMVRRIRALEAERGPVSNRRPFGTRSAIAGKDVQLRPTRNN